MQVDVQLNNLPNSPGVTRDLRARVGRAFARFRTSLNSVSLRIEDINGPRGGNDKECRIVCKLAGGASIVQRRVRLSSRAAVISCIKAAERSLQRRVRRELGRRTAVTS